MATTGTVSSKPADPSHGAAAGTSGMFTATIGAAGSLPANPSLGATVDAPGPAATLLASAAPDRKAIIKTAASLESTLQSWINGVAARRGSQTGKQKLTLENVFGNLANIRDDLRKLQRGDYGFTNETRQLLGTLNTRSLWVVEGAKAAIFAADLNTSRAYTTRAETRKRLNDASAELATYADRIRLGNGQSQANLNSAVRVFARIEPLLKELNAAAPPASQPSQSRPSQSQPSQSRPAGVAPAPKRPPAGSAKQTPQGYRSLDGETDVQPVVKGEELQITRDKAELESDRTVPLSSLLVKVESGSTSTTFPFERIDVGINSVLADFGTLRAMLPKGANAKFDSLLGGISRDWDALLLARNNMAKAVNDNNTGAQQEALTDFQNAAESVTRNLTKAVRLINDQVFAQQALEILKSIPGSPGTDPRFQTRLEQGNPDYRVNSNPFANIWVGLLSGATRFDRSILDWYAGTGMPGAAGARNLSERLESSLNHQLSINRIDPSDPQFKRAAGLSEGVGKLSLGAIASIAGAKALPGLGVLGTVTGGAAGSTLAGVATGDVPSRPGDIGAAFAANFLLGGISFGLADELTNGLSAEALQRNMARVANGLPGTEAKIGPIRMIRVEGGVRVTHADTGASAFYDFARQPKPTPPVDDVIDVAARPATRPAGALPSSKPSAITPSAASPQAGPPSATAALISQLRANGVPATAVKTVAAPGGGGPIAQVTTESGSSLEIRLNPDGTLNPQSLAGQAGVRFVSPNPPGEPGPGVETGPGDRPDPRRFDLSSTYYGRGGNLNDTGAFESYRQFYPNLSDQQWKELKATLISGGLTPDSVVYRGQPVDGVTYSATGDIQTIGKTDPIGRVVDVYSGPAPGGSASSATMPLFSEATRYPNRPANTVAPGGGIYTATTPEISKRYGGERNVVVSIRVDQMLRQGLLPRPDITYAASGAQRQGVSIFWSARDPAGTVVVPSAVVGGTAADSVSATGARIKIDNIFGTPLKTDLPPGIASGITANPGLAPGNVAGRDVKGRFLSAPNVALDTTRLTLGLPGGANLAPPTGTITPVGQGSATQAGQAARFVNPLDGRTLSFDPATRTLTPIDGAPLTPEEKLSYSKPLPPDLSPETARSLLDTIRQKIDLRVGLTAQISNPAGTGAVYRGSIFGGIETIRQLWMSREAIAHAAGQGDVRQLGEIFSRAFGIGQRIGEGLVDPQFVRNWAMMGFGSASILQFKADTLADQARKSFLGQDTAFIFEPDAARNRIEAAVPASEPGDTSILPPVRTGILTGSLRLNATPTTLDPGQVDIFGNSSGEFFTLNRDLKIDKALKEIYLGKLQTPVMDSPSIEYRAESSGQIIIPAGSILPRQFVDIINRRVGGPSYSISFPVPEGDRVGVADLHRFNRAPTSDRPTPTQAGTLMSLAMIDPAKVSVELAERGGVARDSSVPGKPFDSSSRNVDVTFYPGESLLNRLVEQITDKRISNLPPRSVPGARDLFEFFVPQDTNANANKVRWKVNLLPVLKIPGLAKLEINGYLIQEAQKSKPTAHVEGENATTLTFDDGSGPVSVAVPGWFSTMLGRQAGVFGQRTEARDINIVPAGGVESLRTYLNPYLKSGTPEQQDAIRALYEKLFYGPKPLLVDGKALPVSIRDDLLNVFKMLAKPEAADIEVRPLDRNSDASRTGAIGHLR